MCYYPTPKLSPHRRLCISTFRKKAQLKCVEFLCLLSFADERDRVQKKTFTKWVNKHLIKVPLCSLFTAMFRVIWPVIIDPALPSVYSNIHVQIVILLLLDYLIIILTNKSNATYYKPSQHKYQFPWINICRVWTYHGRCVQDLIYCCCEIIDHNVVLMK